ncbi:MAG: endo-1,4-beta-xylanase [Clostridia bacterium]|nr:endo-1,4-beta-xylanase [Clostridia bacterium]
MQTVKIRLDGSGGLSMPEKVLKTVYASAMDFEPDERRLRITPDGTVELQVSAKPYMIHAKITVPLYGTLWVMADNLGEGYTGDFVDFVSEATRTYIAHAKRFAQGIELSPETDGHLRAAVELEHMANRGADTPDNRLYALSHAIYAAEGALVERSRRKAFAAPRKDLKLGCNFSRFESASSRYAKFFAGAFDFATLPFYAGQTVPERDRYAYGYIDKCLGFLTEKNITPKGHPLWFGHKEVNPEWLFGLDYPQLRREAAKIAYHHVSAYKDSIQVWDSMNEAHDWANCFELNQEQLIDLTRATTDALREANDKATSIVNICLPFAEYVAGRYNCYGALPEHLCSPLRYFRRILEAGVDFDVVGIQLYFPARDMVAVSLMLDQFAALGKPIHITEMGVNGGFRVKGSAGSTWSQMDMSEGTWHGGWNERTQADWMEQFYTIAAAREEIQALTWWDFIEPSFSGNGAFLYEDENPREMYFRLLALKDRIKAE